MTEIKIPPPEFRTNGVLTKKGVCVADQSSIDALSCRGYGTLEGTTFSLSFYESLYLMDKGMLDVKNPSGEPLDFQTVLHIYGETNENAWVNYLVYRDLRGRGYVVREGFGVATSFRVYERGVYGKDSASYMVLGMQEGKPLPVDTLADVMQQCQTQKKELIVAVMNRRGEIVYYSVGQLNFGGKEDD
jgi:tRNA-intron endonuclease, archaea type